jgi:hypothetical protein
VPQDNSGRAPFDPNGTAAHERLRRVRATTQPPGRPADGRVFVYAGRRLGGVWLSDIDLQTVTLAAGGLMVDEQEAGTALAMLRNGVNVPLMLDPARYLPSNERISQPSLWSADPLSAVVEGQAQHRVAAYLSPAGFIRAGDLGALRAVLDEGLRFTELTSQQSHRAPALTALPINTGWLSRPELREPFIKTIVEAGIGVALFPGGSGDPLGGQKAVAGLVEMLRAMHHEVAVLRTDLAGIGAMAFGAAAASIGLSAALRHTVAAGGRAFAQQDRTPRVLVDRLLSWPRGSQLAQVVRDNGILTCECPVCHGRSLRRFAREDAEVIGEAATHSVLTWRAIADRMLAVPPAGRRAAWLQACADALDEHAALRARSRIGLQVPDYLNSWTALLA